jgi:4-amino-4-deoxy-L-arabinose transferase-like glycosyltransferase
VLLLCLILCLAAAVRLWLLAGDIPTLNSDEATVGLMALHVWRGDWTVFYWGQPYMGSLEAILAAPAIALVGSTSLGLHLAPILLSLAFLVTIYLLGARLFSQPTGLVSALLLAVGPPFFAVLSVRALGGYIETLLFGNLLLLLALHRPPSRRAALAAAACFGLVAGLALWTDLLVLPYLAVCGALCWWRRCKLRSRAGLALCGGLLVGAAPLVIANVLNGGATVTTLLGLTVLGAHGRATTSASLPGNLVLELLVSLPILCGGFVGGTQVTGLSVADFATLARAHPAAYAANLVLALVALGLLLSAALPLLRGEWRWLREPTPAAPDVADAPGTPRDVARDATDSSCRARQGRAALLLLALCYMAAFAFSKQQDVFTAPRYLFPLYSVTPLLVATAARVLIRVDAALRWRVARWIAPARLASGAPVARRFPTPGALLTPAALLAVFLWSLAGTTALTPRDTAARDHGQWIAGRDDALLALLRAHQVHTVVSNDYWEGLRLTYASGETIITVMVTPEGHPGFNRYRPYVVRGLADPRPAYVELSGTPEAALDAQRLRSGALPGYTSQHVGAFTVLLPAERYAPDASRPPAD